MIILGGFGVMLFLGRVGRSCMPTSISLSTPNNGVVIASFLLSITWRDSRRSILKIKKKYSALAFNSELSERAESIYIFARSAWLSFRIDYISLIVNYTIFNLRKIHITLGSLWAMWGKYKGSAFKLVCFALACIIFFDSYVMVTSPSHNYRFYYSPLETTRHPTSM